CCSPAGSGSRWSSRLGTRRREENLHMGDGRPHAAEVAAARNRTLAPSEAAAAKLASQRKLYVRDRIARLFDEGTFVEDGQLANANAANLPADGVVTGRGMVDGRPALVVANDPSVKAGSW